MTLRQNVVAIQLARCLYYLHGPYYSVAVRDFDHLEPTDKQRWVDEAEAALEAVKPIAATRPDYFGLAAQIARREASKVIGTITPDAPWGI